MSSNLEASAVVVEASEDDAGKRLDRWLAGAIPELSRARLQALIEQGAVSDLDACETIGSGSQPVKPGRRYAVRVPPPVDTEVQGEAIALDIVYEDDEVIVVDKPAGLVVHPAAGHETGTLVNALIAHCGASLSGVGGVRRPGIVHRIDKDTSGLLVVAKNDKAHAALSDQFKSHGRDGRLHRAYLAFAWGQPVRPAGTIDAPLSRSDANRTKIAVTRGVHGREAITHYALVESYAGADGEAGVASLLKATLETGRTHQIRVHLAHIGHPLLGDSVYGAGFKTRSVRLPGPAGMLTKALSRQALHAAELGFEHPSTGEYLSFSSDLPAELASLRQALSGAAATEIKPARRSAKRR